MPTTPTYALPYPAATDPANVPLDMQELAERLELVFPGKELAYAQITAPVAVPVVAEAAAVTVVSAGAVTFDGGPVLIEFFTQQMQTANVVASSVLLSLWDGASNLGFFGQFATPAAAVLTVSTRPARRLTPTAGAHTYIVKAFATGGAGNIGAGIGGAAGTVAPAFIRIIKI